MRINYFIISNFITVAVAALFATATVAGNNCSSQQNTVEDRYDVCYFSDCKYLTPGEAAAVGATLCARVIGDGAVPDDTGNKTVNNWTRVLGRRISLPNTWTGYCCGDKGNLKNKIKGTPLDESEINAIADEIADAIDELKLGLLWERVTNESSKTIKVWTGEPCCGADTNGFLELKPGQKTPVLMDADHVQDTKGNWWKVGRHLCEVYDDRVKDCECKVSSFNKPCD